MERKIKNFFHRSKSTHTRNRLSKSPSSSKKLSPQAQPYTEAATGEAPFRDIQYQGTGSLRNGNHQEASAPVTTSNYKSTPSDNFLSRPHDSTTPRTEETPLASPPASQDHRVSAERAPQLSNTLPLGSFSELSSNLDRLGLSGDPAPMTPRKVGYNEEIADRNIEQNRQQSSNSDAIRLVEDRTHTGKESISAQRQAALDGIVDLHDTTDTEVIEKWAPAVTHETIEPQVHHIREEQIHREIHTYDVYHRVQPVHDVQVLPTLHFIPGTNGELHQVAKEDLPDYCHHKDRDWLSQEIQALLTNPSIKFPRRPVPNRSISEKEEKSEVTSEGFMRRETRIVHPPQLEDMRDYSGPVMPIYFDENEQPHELPIQRVGASNGIKDEVNNTTSMTLQELTDSMRKDGGRGMQSTDEELVPPRKGLMRVKRRSLRT